MEGKNLTAQEARRITEANTTPLEKALNMIESSAKHGYSTIMFNNISDDTMIKLAKLGYSVTVTKDPVGVEVKIISW